jgi:hypothetical protein
MIELKASKLHVSFPEMPFQPKLTINFQRTLRIPDDGKNYPLPPGLGHFPLRHIDDYADLVPQQWLKRGGVILPMWQSEALWLHFQGDYLSDRNTRYPFAVKIATGKINAVTGEIWSNGLSRNPQNYVVIPRQPWLDGYCVEKGIIRQFVAMPLGEGYSAEEQITGKAEFGGMQIEVFPMRAEIFEQKFPIIHRQSEFCGLMEAGSLRARVGRIEMGLAPGGRMRQEIYADPHSIHDWDTEHRSRCFVHLVNSTTWHTITGERPPSKPLTAQDYTRAGYPWFDYFDAETKALLGADPLAALKSVNELSKEKGTAPLADNQPVSVTNLVTLKPHAKTDVVRESSFD